MRNGSMGVENIVQEATELLDIGDLSSSTFSWSSSTSLELQLDRSAYNGVCQQVLELKILLLQLRRLLDWVRLLLLTLIMVDWVRLLLLTLIMEIISANERHCHSV
jgi:hypothetical protein